jgi:hypothetical protein
LSDKAQLRPRTRGRFFHAFLHNGAAADAGHDALMTLYRTRFSGQIKIIKAEELPSVWREGL